MGLLAPVLVSTPDEGGSGLPNVKPCYPETESKLCLPFPVTLSYVQDFPQNVEEVG